MRRPAALKCDNCCGGWRSHVLPELIVNLKYLNSTLVLPWRPFGLHYSAGGARKGNLDHVEIMTDGCSGRRAQWSRWTRVQNVGDNSFFRSAKVIRFIKVGTRTRGITRHVTTIPLFLINEKFSFVNCKFSDGFKARRTICLTRKYILTLKDSCFTKTSGGKLN